MSRGSCAQLRDSSASTCGRRECQSDARHVKPLLQHECQSDARYVKPLLQHERVPDVQVIVCPAAPAPAMQVLRASGNTVHGIGDSH